MHMLLSLFCNYLYFMVGSHQPMAALPNLLMQIKCVCVCICVYARRERKYLILIRYDANSEVIYSNVEKIYIIKGYLLELYKSLASDTTRHNTIMPYTQYLFLCGFPCTFLLKTKSSSLTGSLTSCAS